MNAYAFAPRRVAPLLCALLMGASLFAEEDVVWYDAKGIPWQYTLYWEEGTVMLTRTPLSRALRGAVEVPAVIDGYSLRRIGTTTFGACSGITSITIPASVTIMDSYPFAGSSVEKVVFLSDEISANSYLFAQCPELRQIVFPKRIRTLGAATFWDCRSLKVCLLPNETDGVRFYQMFDGCLSLEYVRLPPALSEAWDRSTFEDCDNLRQVVFTGAAPQGASVNLIPNNARITYPKAEAAVWGEIVPESRRGTFTELIDGAGVAVSSRMIGPRAMEVSFEVTSDMPEVTVRAIALKDGVKSFANVIPIRSLSAGTLGAVPANTPLRFVWNIAKDWRADLENATPLILVQEESLLPIDEVTLPGEGDLPPFTVNRVPLHETQVFDALLWCYAEGDPRLTVTQGVASVDGTPVAEGETVTDLPKALEFLCDRMGYRAMTPAEAEHWRRVTRVSYDSYGLENLQVRKQEGE